MAALVGFLPPRFGALEILAALKSVMRVQDLDRAAQDGAPCVQPLGQACKATRSRTKPGRVASQSFDGSQL